MWSAINLGTIYNYESLIGYVCAKSGLYPNSNAGEI